MCSIQSVNDLKIFEIINPYTGRQVPHMLISFYHFLLSWATEKTLVYPTSILSLYRKMEKLSVKLDQVVQYFYELFKGFSLRFD